MSGAPANPLETLNPPTPGAPENRPRRMKCEFCHCEVATSGEYFRLSDRAKELRGAEERIERLNAELAKSNEKITALTTECNELRTQVANRASADDDEDY